ncbi:MAG TPA: monovalent cation:proton antiporter-2 (CPA2) family protein [Fibrobacteria bacterium]|nr:monovalent cation:proton antiporter-2 (CPA2) family protein [Fibrobacteria bacterium]
MTHTPLLQAFIYLAVAVVAVPISKRAGFGSVLGYLLAGVLIGPHLLGWAGQGEDVRQFAEFGVIMMLFLIGLELQPKLLWKLRVPILGLGTLQVAVSAAVLALGALALGAPWKAAVAIGLTLSMSSTAIVLQSLAEKRLDKTAGGQSAFSVLLFQDIAVIPILALLPFLASASAAAKPAGHGGVAALSPGLQALSVLGAVVAVIAGGRFLARPLFRYIAGSRLREIFTAFALLLVVGITLLMEQVGMSPALGAFLAGVVLADSEYRHELEGDIEPFKGLLLGLFFISVGAGVDVPYVLGEPLPVAGLVLAIMLVKAAVLLGLAKAFKLERSQGVLLAMSLCQVGEFAFVLLGLIGQLRVLEGDTMRLLVAAVALSMVATPPLLILLERIVLIRFARAAEPAREMDKIESEDAPVLIAGFGRMGNVIGRLLQVNGIRTTVMDHNHEVVEVVRKLGLKAYYGDASRLDLLYAAGAGKAKVFILAIDDPDKTLEIAAAVRQHFPHLALLCRAKGRNDGYGLINMGVKYVYRETMGTSMDMGMDALRLTGMRAFHANRAVHAFRSHNDGAFRDLAKHWSDRKNFLALLRGKIEEADSLLRNGGQVNSEVDAAWDNSNLREGMREVLQESPADRREGT